MDKKQVYCRYCGKLIDEDAPFCTYCGRKQNNDIKSSSIWNTTFCFLQNIYSKSPQIKFKSDRTFWNNVKIWLKRIIVLLVVLIVIWLIVLLCFWLYGSHLASEWTKEDERREAIALKDINKADDIARQLFEEEENGTHSFNGLISSECSYSHKEKAVFILRNAAESGNANAQFTLGELYYSRGAFECQDFSYRDATDFYTCLSWSNHINLNSGEYIINNISEDIGKEYLRKGAYWFSKAANQGHVRALFYLGVCYNKGCGVKSNLLKGEVLIKKAAVLGEPNAQLFYGDMLRTGEICIGVHYGPTTGNDEFFISGIPNISLAKEWWTKALKNGNEKARERLEKVYE